MGKLFGVRTISAIAGVSLISSMGTSVAQDYPSGPITMIVPGSAGSASDITARIIADGMSEALGQSVAVQDRPAGGGTVAGATVADAPADGYTVLFINMSLATAESLHPDRGYVFMEDLAPVGSFASSFFVYAVNPAVEAQTFEEFIEHAKAKPGTIDYSAAAVGTATYMATELLKSAAGIDIQHIPYNGGAPALASVVAGETQFSAAPFPSAKPFIEGGELRALAVSSAERVPYLPDVPAVAETVPGFEFGSWYGLAVPTDTPENVRDRLFEALRDAAENSEVKDQLEAQGLDVAVADASKFSGFLSSTIDALARIAKENHLTAQ